MRASIVTAFLAGLSLVSAAPRFTKRTFATSQFTNGFPTPNAKQVSAIQEQGRGTLSNVGTKVPGKPASPAAIVNLRVIALQEIFEAAYFSDLLHNITTNQTGYENLSKYGDRQQIIDQINATIAQEQMHTLTANGALAAAGEDPIQSCTFTYNVTTFEQAIETAALFTDVVLGTLQSVEMAFAQNGDFDLVHTLASIISQEGEQNGFFRTMQNTKGKPKKIASQLPFLTASTGPFAATALSEFIVGNTCNATNLKLITDNVMTFIPLTVTTQNIEPRTQPLNFSFPIPTWDAASWNNHTSTDNLTLVYINQQNLPIMEPIANLTVWNDDLVTFGANFPYEENLMNGLTIAAVARKPDPAKGFFSSAEEVASYALVAPGLIDIN
jgi:hypothetical protein